MNIEPQTPQERCGYKEGALPPCAPLAVGYVPTQSGIQPRYNSQKALARGTLFPGLDLPLKNIVNTGVADIPTAELMALDFAAHDLSLYLDTHAEDEEAFSVYRELLELAEEGRKTYVERYGPVCKTDLKNESAYNWLKDPWPWDRMREENG